MGAQSIFEEFEGHYTQKQLNDWHVQQKARDRDYNGHREGYSGDWQTVSSIKMHHAVIHGKREAEELALDKAMKWEYGYAVHYLDETGTHTLVGAWAAC